MAWTPPDSSVDGQPKRLLATEAAQILGVGVDAVYKRVRRGTLEHERDDEGRLWIFLDTDSLEADKAMDTATDPATQELIALLREELAHEKEVNRENRRIIAGLVQRIPAIEAPPDTLSEPSESPQRTAEPWSDTQAPPEQEERRSWWRRFFGP